MPPAPEAEPEPRDWVDRFIMPFITEPTLWPVLIVLVAHAVAFIGPALLFAVRDDFRSSQIIVALLFLLSALVIRFEWRRDHRLAALTLTTVITWLASVAFAYITHQTNLF